MAKTMTPDKALRVARAKGYPKEVWWFVACFVAVVSFCQFGVWATNKLSKTLRKVDAEAGTDPSRGRFSVRHIPRALVNAYRVVVFRWTLNIGSSYTLSIAEVAVSCAYFIAIFIWEFINSSSSPLYVSHLALTLTSSATDLQGEKYDIAYWGNRAGTIAASQMPLVTALGTKNNVLSCE